MLIRKVKNFYLNCLSLEKLRIRMLLSFILTLSCVNEKN